MVKGTQKPRYSGQMESGVLLFLAPGEMRIVKDYGIQSGDKST